MKCEFMCTKCVCYKCDKKEMCSECLTCKDNENFSDVDRSQVENSDKEEVQNE